MAIFNIHEILRGKLHEISCGNESSKTQNGHISFKTVEKWKNKGTLFSPTFKVQESNVPLYFNYWTVLNKK